MKDICLVIDVKKNKGKRYRSSIDVQYDLGLGEIKLKEIGDTVISLNKSAEVTIEYCCFNSISGTWMVLMSYYANVKRLVKH